MSRPSNNNNNPAVFPPGQANPASSFEAMFLTSEHPWTSRDIGTNAISSIMTDPNADRRAAASQRPLDNPAQTTIRKVRNTEFEPYLNLISDAYGRYEFNRAVGMEGMPTMVDPADSSSFSDLADMIGMDANAGKKDSYAMHRAKNTAASVPPLTSVPSVYFQVGFNLENPHTFTLVTEAADGPAGSVADGGLATASAGNTANGRPPGAGAAASSSSSALAYSSSVLQEKLSHYLDTVEIHLVKEISRRSTSFFAALSNLQSLHSETLECVGEISQVRTRLARLAQNTSKQGLRVVRLKRRRANLADLLRSLTLIGELRQTQPMVQLLLGQNDYVAALDLIGDAFATIQSVRNSPTRLAGAASVTTTNTTTPVEGTAPADLDYRSIKAISHTYGQLSEVYRTIGLVMEAEFVSLLGGFVREPSEFASVNDIAAKLSMDPPPDANRLGAIGDTDPQSLLDRIAPTLGGLVHTRKIVQAMRVFKETARRDLKNVTKEYYRSVANSAEKSAAGGPKNALAAQLRSMSFDAFFSLLSRVYGSHLIFLKRTALALRTVVDAIGTVDEKTGAEAAVIDIEQYRAPSDADVLPVADETIGKPEATGAEEMDEVDALNAPEGVEDAEGVAPATRPGLASPAKFAATGPAPPSDAASAVPAKTLSDLQAQATKEAASIVAALADLSHTRCAKLLSVRSEFNSQLNAKDFRRLYNTTWTFVAATEAVCGKPTLGLKGAIVNQSRAFLRNFHEEKMKQIALLIESEPWTQAAVPLEFQAIADSVCGETGKPVGPVISSSSDPGQSRASEDDGGGGGADGGSSNRFLLIKGQRYYAVGCVLIFVKMIADYLQCLEDVPTVLTEVIHDLLEILTVFNSRVCQVILGAGAVASLGLKNITAKHLGENCFMSKGSLLSFLFSLTFCLLFWQPWHPRLWRS